MLLAQSQCNLNLSLFLYSGVTVLWDSCMNQWGSWKRQWLHIGGIIGIIILCLRIKGFSLVLQNQNNMKYCFSLNEPLVHGGHFFM